MHKTFNLLIRTLLVYYLEFLRCLAGFARLDGERHVTKRVHDLEPAVSVAAGHPKVRRTVAGEAITYRLLVSLLHAENSIIRKLSLPFGVTVFCMAQRSLE